jgi:hypothetical protein
MKRCQFVPISRQQLFKLHTKPFDRPHLGKVFDLLR